MIYEYPEYPTTSLEMQNIRGRGFVTFDFKSTLALETNVVTTYPVIPFGHVPVSSLSIRISYVS